MSGAGESVRIGPYRVIKPIDAGGQGRVFLGYDERLSRRVAIKVYEAPLQRAARRALLREARLIAAIQSPRVVAVYDIITSSEHLAMVMEYVPGTDLERVLQHTRTSVASAITVGIDVAAGLAAVRQQRVVHGDLKARNVLVTAQGRLKLTDFGIARHSGAAGGETASPSAISPEQVLGQPPDIRSDLFCLGCLLYRMLSGRHPFMAGGRVLPDLLLADAPAPLAEAVPPAMDLPPELERLVHRLLRADPRDRPANTHEVRRELRAIERQLPLAAGNALLLESCALFRDEPPPERPPDVPLALQREGRSRMGPSATEHPWSWQNPEARPRVLAAAFVGLSALALAATLGWQYWLGLPVRVHVTEPEVRIHPDHRLPDWLSVEWLVEQVTGEVERQLGTILVTGPVGATPLQAAYSAGLSPADRPAREQLAVAVHCDAQFCLLDLRREVDGVEFRAAAMLAAGRSLQQWQRELVRATRALYRQSGVPLARGDQAPPSRP